MSRVGRMPVKVLPGVKVHVSAAAVQVEGPKGKLTQPFHPSMKVSLDGDNWQTVSSVGSTDGSTTLVVDLNEYVGRLIYVRFVFDAAPPPMGAAPDVWRIGRVVIDVRR